MLVKLFTSDPAGVKDLPGPVPPVGSFARAPRRDDGETRDLNPGKRQRPGQGSARTFFGRTRVGFVTGV